MELPGVESWWEGSKLLPFKGGQCPLPHPKQVDCKGSPTPRWAILPQGIAWQCSDHARKCLMIGEAVLLASSDLGPGVLPSTLHCTGQPHPHPKELLSPKWHRR
jgi:hypothetical protein